MPKLKIKTQFKEAINYIKETKKHIYAIILIFLFSALTGFLFNDALNNKFRPLIENIVSNTEGLNAIELVFYILQNNLQSAVLSVIFGVVFGIFPIINAMINGALIGYALAITANAVGFSSWWRLLPHGIFELPAILVALGLGTKLGFSFFARTKNKKQEFLRRWYNSMNALLLIIIPLLIIAAFIEGLLIALFS